MTSISSLPFAAQIRSAAASHGVDPSLLAALAAQETGGPGSNGGRNVVGDGGHGHGIFQIDDRFHAFARTPQAMDPQANADYAAGMLSGLLKRYGGNVREALSAYNAGSPDAAGTVTQWPDGSRLGYADSVMRHYASIESGGSLLDEMSAESPGEQQNVNALASFASLQMPALTPPALPQDNYSYRQIAGLDDKGNSKQAPDLGSIVYDGDSSDDSTDDV